MRPVLGDLLAATSGHIDAVTRWQEPLPPAAARAAVAELARLLTTMARCANAFVLADDSGPPHVLELAARAEWDARAGLRRAAVRMRVAVSVLGDQGETRNYDHAAVVRLAQAADCLAAGHDLLQTHFRLGPFGSRHGNSRWAPVITSTQVNHVLLAAMAGYAHRIAPWVIRLPVANPADEALPPPARIAVSAACQWLRAAEAAAWASSHHQPHDTAETRTLLYAIPVNTAPYRHPPGAGETVPRLCQGTIATAERLRHLTHATAGRPHQPGTVTAASWQRIAHGAAITGHCSEMILRSLTEPASQLAAVPNAAASPCPFSPSATASQHGCPSHSHNRVRSRPPSATSPSATPQSSPAPPTSTTQPTT
jgi:hypothetical protein